MPFHVTPDVSIDLTDRRRVAIIGSGGEPYQPLSKAQQSRLVDAIQGRYQFPTPEEDLDNAFWHYLRDWKINGIGVGAKRHEAIVKQEFDVDSGVPIRGGSIAWEPPQSMCNAMRMLHEVSKAFLREHHGDELTVYRGLSHEAPQILRTLIEDPSHSPVYPEQSVLSNYSTSPDGAAYFSRLVTTQTLTVSDIALAANFLFAYSVTDFERDNQRIDTLDDVLSPNAELRVRNDREYPYDLDDLYLAVGNPTSTQGVALRPFREILQALPDLSVLEHAALGAVFQACVDDGFTDSAPITSALPLQAWESRFQNELGLSPPPISSLTT